MNLANIIPAEHQRVSMLTAFSSKHPCAWAQPHRAASVAVDCCCLVRFCVFSHFIRDFLASNVGYLWKRSENKLNSPKCCLHYKISLLPRASRLPKMGRSQWSIYWTNIKPYKSWSCPGSQYCGARPRRCATTPFKPLNVFLAKGTSAPHKGNKLYLLLICPSPLLRPLVNINYNNLGFFQANTIDGIISWWITSKSSVN